MGGAVWCDTIAKSMLLCSTPTRYAPTWRRRRRRLLTVSSPSSSSVTVRCCSSSSSSLSLLRRNNSSSQLRFAVLGAGFAGLSVAWHLLSHSPSEVNLHVDVFDEFGIGGGASGVAGGLIHPYSPKVKLLWRAEECWTECLNLLNVAEHASNSTDAASHFGGDTDHFLVRRTGILRPATNEKYLNVMHENALKCLPSCRIEVVDGVSARNLIPYLSTPLDTAFFMPEAVNVNPQTYLQALFLACERLVSRVHSAGSYSKSISLRKKFVASLRELEDEYDAVIVCTGARADMLPELSGKLPLRTCRGVVAHLQLLDALSEEYPEHSPSILSDAWFAVQGPQKLCLGSTWEWGSRNYSSLVSTEEASTTLGELLPKACTVYPQISKWTLTEARAGLRAMPPLTPHGSLPLLGCIDDLVGGSSPSKFWLIGGLGSRGLLFHGWLGKLTARAVLARSEDILPPELTTWRRMKRK